MPPALQRRWSCRPEKAPRWRRSTASALVRLGCAVAFRRAINAALRERDHEIEHAQMLIRELEHWTKNTFAPVLGLLQAPRRREPIDGHLVA